MGKASKHLFAEDSDSEAELKTENEYAKNYNLWRQKEELNKLKTKYGDDVLDGNESSSSSDDDEDAAELTEEVEKGFYKTLSYLKKKDPKIYDNNFSFFKSKGEDTKNSKKEKKSKEQPMYLKDYERKLLLEKGGILSDEDDESQPKSTYVKEQEQIKEEIVKLGATVESDNESEDEKTGGILALRKKTKEEENEQEAEYLKWLAGQAEEIQDSQIKTELKPLKEFWNDPNLDDGEKFLRDYVLKKRYLEKDNDDYIPSYDEIVHDSDDSLSGDEEEIEKQEEFEHKYNFRFEEPDQEFIKRYPRTIEQSLRKTDDRRKLKRAETKERKQKEKEEKMAELKKLQELKRKEIEEKIEKLKEVTGNTDLAFQDDDIDGDFDPEAHDKRMQALFNDQFYEGPETDQKPVFPDLDEELEIENWDYWNGEENSVQDTNVETGPHCEDDNFNMDADYDPSSASLKDELVANRKGKKKGRRKSKVAEALKRPKPKFDPNDKNYERYFDEYYKLDCEDIIGDLPCRFKYREVIPNDFGLTVEEILLAKDKELNRWCSLKKTIQRRPEKVEVFDQIAYAKRANDITLKKRLLPSLFSEEADQDQTPQKLSESNKPSVVTDSLLNKNDALEKGADKSPEDAESTPNPNDANSKTNGETKKRKRRKNKKKKAMNVDSSTSRQDAVVISDSSQSKEISVNKIDKEDSKPQHKGNKKNKKRKRNDSDISKRGAKKFKKNKETVDIGISDARLAAFGINPKKFKNKLKYGNKNKS